MLTEKTFIVIYIILWLDSRNDMHYFLHIFQADRRLFCTHNMLSLIIANLLSAKSYLAVDYLLIRERNATTLLHEEQQERKGREICDRQILYFNLITRRKDIIHGLCIITVF